MMKPFKRYLFNKGIKDPVYIDLSGNHNSFNHFLDILELAIRVNKSDFPIPFPLNIHIILDWKPNRWSIRWNYSKDTPPNSIHIGDKVYIENQLQNKLNTASYQELKDFYVGPTNYLLLNDDLIPGVEVIAKSEHWMLVHDPLNKLDRYIEYLAEKGLLPFTIYDYNVLPTLYH